MATAATAPSRAKINDFVINKVLRIEAGTFSVNCLVKDANGSEAGNFPVTFRNGECQGINYAADGSPQSFSSTVPAGFTEALTEFFRAGNLSQKSLFVEAYAILKGLIPG